MKRIKVLTIAKISIFAALSTVLYFIRIPLPPFPSFLEIQFSNLPLIIGGFIVGPIGAVIMVLVKTVLTLPFSTTQYVGELADLLIGAAVVLMTSITYKKINTKKGGIIALLLGMIVWIITACIANKFILLPYYMKVAGIKVDDFVSVLKAIPWTSFIKIIDSSNYLKIYILACVIPFNLVISSLVSIITFIVYKRVSKLFHKMEENLDK